MMEQSQKLSVAAKRFFSTPTHRKKFIFFFIADAAIIIFSLYFSFLLRLDFTINNNYRWLFYFALPSFLIVKLMSFSYFKLYKLSWRFVSLKDLYSILKAVVSSSSALMLGIYFFRFSLFQGFPRSIILIDAFTTFLLVALLRISKRAFFEVLKNDQQFQGKRTVIVGAGNTGEMILRDMQRSALKEYTPVAFVDDDKNKIGTYIHGVKVMGALSELNKLMQAYQALVVVIAIPSFSHNFLREIYRQAKIAGAEEIKIVPRIYDFHRPEIRAKELEDIKIEDLIGRQTIRIDFKEIRKDIEDKIVLVTGAGGSIGSELTRQICGLNPRRLILFEIDETELYRVELIIKRDFSMMADRLHLVVGDIRDVDRVEKVFEAYKPEVVFHAAAYKHVPMMEYNASEAVKVNIIGTYNIVKAAKNWSAERFVMISTDKAVKPRSVMGATKRLAEDICRAFNENGKTEFLSVRFGNVLGSRGSVLPLFLEQIQNGGPLLITHQDMKRYFMTIPEAVSLVLQASVIGRGGDIMVLDMGEPVNILELAKDLVRLHGLEPHKDIDIKIIGIRPGEKLFEEILTADEGAAATRHEKIYVSQTKISYTIFQAEDIIKRFENIIKWTFQHDEREIRQMLKEYVQGYQGNKEVMSEVSLVDLTGQNYLNLNNLTKDDIREV